MHWRKQTTRPNLEAFILLLSSDKRDFSGNNYTKGNNNRSKRKSHFCPILRFDPQLNLSTGGEERLISDQMISRLPTRNIHCGESFTSSVTKALKSQNWWGVCILSEVPLIWFTFKFRQTTSLINVPKSESLTFALPFSALYLDIPKDTDVATGVQIS